MRAGVAGKARADHRLEDAVGRLPVDDPVRRRLAARRNRRPPPPPARRTRGRRPAAPPARSRAPPSATAMPPPAAITALAAAAMSAGSRPKTVRLWLSCENVVAKRAAPCPQSLRMPICGTAGRAAVAVDQRQSGSLPSGRTTKPSRTSTTTSPHWVKRGRKIVATAVSTARQAEAKSSRGQRRRSSWFVQGAGPVGRRPCESVARPRRPRGRRR